MLGALECITAESTKVKANEFIIHLEIAGKKYPVTLRRGDVQTERRVREAARRVQQMYLERKSQFSKVVEDKDLLAMVAIQLATDMIPLEERNDTKPFTDHIRRLTTELEAFLKANR